MNNTDNITKLQLEIKDLKTQLFEANSLIEAIREGAVDALVLNKDGQPFVYSIESADYTYRVLIEKFGEGALSISENGLILYCNEYFAKLAGIPANLITGTFFSAFVDSPAEFDRIQAALEDGPSKDEIIMKLGGEKIHVYISLTDLRPNVEAIGVVVTDLSEKRKHEEALVQYQTQLERKVIELHETNTSLEQFIHVISHDIKEPLRKILTYTSHLSDNKSELFSARELKNLNTIHTSAIRLNSLVDDLVKYAFSTTTTDFKDIDLNAVVAEVIDDLELVVAENNAVFRIEKLPVLVSSKVQLRQLFSNLIANAIKYSREGVNPEITIACQKITGIDALATDQPYHKITISDNGIGMDGSHLSKIFTIFQRLHMREEYSGNGIGLAICKKIMENHHGKIDVESVQGQGSTFNLYFPITNK